MTKTVIKKPVSILNTHESTLLVIGCHYVLKNQYIGLSKQEIFSDLMCEIDNFNLDDVANCAIEILSRLDKTKLN
tara:strand:- start:537 stop:761 length:225 start_codon:yes stop_codon:yes gene_type:complete